MKKVLELEYEFLIKPDINPELSHYVLEFSGRATCWDDEAGEDRDVAKMRGHRIDLALARHDGVDIDELFESLYPDILEFEATTFRDSTCWLTEPDPSGHPVECACLVYIDELVVAEDYRSNGIGTGMMKRMTEVIDLEDCLVGLKAFPISSEYGRKRSTEELQRLRAFYHQLGFVHAGKHFFEKDGNKCYAPQKRKNTPRSKRA